MHFTSEQNGFLYGAKYGGMDGGQWIGMDWE